jgi:cell division septation protein DedD/Tfp pilus assembly protein PilF
MKIIKLRTLCAILLPVFNIFLTNLIFAEEDWFEKGLMLTRARQYDEAVQAFTAAIELIPSDFEAYNYRGVARTYQGDYDGAIADYGMALRIKPEYAEALNNRGFAWVKKGNLGRALNDISRAILINPLLLDAYNSKAWIMATSSQTEYRDGKAAVALAQQAVEISADINSLDTLAAAYAASGQFDKAISTQKRVIHLLVQQESIDRLAPFLDHLNSYKAGNALRINYASATSPQKTNKFKKPPEDRIAPEASRTAAYGNPAASAGSHPYTIQVSAYRDPAKSLSVALSLVKKGDPAFACPVHIPGKGDWHRVFIGSYRSRSEAREAAEALKKRRFQYVQVTRKPYAVQVGLFESETAAREVIGRLRAKGYITYSLTDQGQTGQMRILIGAYSTRDGAKKLSEQLTKDGFTSLVLPR